MLIYLSVSTMFSVIFNSFIYLFIYLFICLFLVSLSLPCWEFKLFPSISLKVAVFSFIKFEIPECKDMNVRGDRLSP